MTSASERKTESKSTGALKYAPGERPLFFNNRGLFSDPFLSHHLPELEDVTDKDASAKYLNTYWNEPNYEGYNDFNLAFAQMQSLWDQYSEFLPDYNEAQLEERWIKPILKLLGWTYEVQDAKTKRSKRNVPDYSLFLDEEQYVKAKRTKTDEAYFEHVLAVADAKAWKLALDGIGRTNSNPSYQIVRYMEHANVQWGILTNGRFWRLYSLRSSTRHTTYYEIDLERMLVKRNDEQFKYFYNFFRKSAFVRNEASQQCFLDVVFENGVYYAREAEANLKARVFGVVENIAKGFISGRADLGEAELKEIYDHSLYYLFKLMFVLNCESKGLLAVDKTSDYYQYSLRKHIKSLKEQYDSSQNWSSQSRTYSLIQDLFDLLAKGDDRIGVHGFGHEVFSSGDKSFYTKNRIPDFYLNEALIQLACDYGDHDELQFIDYKRLSEDHLGSLFEGLLEFEIAYADQDKFVSEKGEVVDWQDATEKQKQKFKKAPIKKGEPFLSNSSGERRTTGSYYTPQPIVDFMIAQTLGPLCESLNVQSLLKMTVCDPAMGSGHFLIGAVKYLENRVQELIFQSDENDDVHLEEIRWKLLYNCIFGVDINPLAVELAKFSLWMYSATPNSKLDPLSNFRLGNSLIGDELFEQKFDKEVRDKVSKATKPFRWKQEFKSILGAGGFDAIVGNPPYRSLLLGKKHQSEIPEIIAYYQATLPKSAQYKMNSFALFMERCVGLMRDHGTFCFIVPSTFYTTQYFRDLRKFMLAAGGFEKLYDLRYKVFEEAEIGGNAVFVFHKADQKKQMSAYSISKENELYSKPPIKVDSAAVTSDPDCNLLKDNSSSSIEDAIRKVATKQLGEICTIYQGIITGDNGRFLAESKKGRRWSPILRGRDIDKYATHFGGMYVDFDPEELWSNTNEKMFKVSEKIVSRQTSDRLIATIDSESYFTLDSTHVIHLKEPIFSLKYLLGIYNSKLLNYLYQSKVRENGRAFAQVKTVNLKPLPIRMLDLKKSGDKTAHDKIVSLVDRLLSANGSNLSAISSEIDQEVYSLYGLSQAQIESIERAGSEVTVEPKPKKGRKSKVA